MVKGDIILISFPF